jgi:Bifunctional DNA primase/polymerase, N-terminal
MQRTAAMPQVFIQYQPRYAAVGIPTFPCIIAERKRPMVKNYGRMGLPASYQLVLKGLDGDAFACMAGQRNKLTILDIDAQGAKGEGLLADAQCRFGRSQFIVRTGGGGFHAYYRHNGEPRRVRPDPRQPIDLLGGGMVVLPPSRGALRTYEIIEGHIDDLAALTPLRRDKAADSLLKVSPDLELVSKGARGDTLWRHCMRMAHHCDDLETLIDVARTRSDEMLPPIEDDVRIVETAKQAWKYTVEGKNLFGRPRSTRLSLSGSSVDALVADPILFALISWLKVANGPNAKFLVANGLATRLGWSINQLRTGRRRAVESGWLVKVRHEVKGRAALYRWGPTSTRHA